ncbi:MAG: DUF2635 domain-containing protein [Methylococcales bacterium]|nr:DUF2635 domain-containing protein [Methylococcales bacterium]
MFVKPADGAQVPDPDRNDFLPAEGREVEAKSYWFRRIENEEVYEVAATATIIESTSTKGVN